MPMVKAWKSLHEWIQLLKRGIHWTVGNGRDILIWHDAWIPDLPRFRVSSAPPQADRPMIVKDLIDFERRCWKENVVRALFNQNEAKAIKKIHIGSEQVPDRITWHFTRDGNYSVKSGTWRKIWKLNVAPKIQNFVWRACRNIIPTKENLVKRHCSYDPDCVRCNEDVESLEHIIFFCPLLKRHGEPLTLAIPQEEKDLLGARDHNGELVDGASYFNQANSVDLAEALVVRLATRLACRRGWRNVIFESDNKDLVGRLSSTSKKDRWDTRTIELDIESLTCFFDCFSFSFIHRSANRAADWVAKTPGKDVVLLTGCILSPPAALVGFLN
ncbi:hypothetical protein COLO4_15019 [Corchorus olitorius]|uniref:Reverse transcriptase zinc-binding domain-containing protein n=1 Tax=Corchorus olitorius TaxID=93759 RepID=A0A1R3JPU5_9ROSI|nr:hypothetical protein COLO4_15019 [Corchorus olitorius]